VVTEVELPESRTTAPASGWFVMLSRTKPLITVCTRAPPLSPVSLGLTVAGLPAAAELSPAAGRVRALFWAPALAAARDARRRSAGSERGMGDPGSAFHQVVDGAVDDRARGRIGEAPVSVS